MLVAPAFTGPGTEPEATESAVPAWQQVPRDLLPARQGISPLKDSAPVPWPDTLAAQLNATLKTDGGGTFTGVVQDAATGQVLFDRGGAESRVPASNMKLLTAAAAVRALGPGPPLQYQGGGRRRNRIGGPDRRRRRAARRGGVRPGRRHGPRRARHPRPAHGQVPAGKRHQGPGAGAAGRLPVHRPGPEPDLEPGGRGCRRDGPAVPAGPEFGPVRPRRHHRAAPAGRRDDRRRGVLRPAHGGRRRRRTDGDSRRRARQGAERRGAGCRRRTGGRKTGRRRCG